MAQIERLHAVMLLEQERTERIAGERPVYAAAKRALDIAIAVTGLIICMPILLIAALMIRLESPGPVLFRQQRMGRNRTPFCCYKLRTMIDDAELLLAKDEALARRFREAWKLHDDPRVTSLGRFLRRASIDELPQLWNVLCGHMSIVGPRPVQLPELDERYGKFANLVVSVRPGLTGLWQVMGRSSVGYVDRVALDVQYVQRRSLWLDIGLIVRTVPAVLMRRGAI